MKTLSEQFYMAGQSWNYITVVATEWHKLQVEIRRNTHDFQSYIRGNAFDPVHLKWNTLVTRPIETASCSKAHYVRKDEPIGPFQDDANLVLAELLAIVGD